MSSRRTLILIAAILVGALAAYALYNYVSGIEDRAYDRAERVEVFKVAQDIPKGLPGEQARLEGYIVAAKIPRELLPETRITSLDQIDGKVALNNLSANQILVEGMFVDPAAALITFGERLGEDEVAITISVDNVRGVAGLLVPGDQVNILVKVTPSEGEEEVAPPPEEEEGALVSPYTAPARYLYQRAHIIAIGRSTVPEPGETVEQGAADVQGGIITLAVPPEAAQRIASVDPASIYLSLVPPDYAPRPLPPFDVDEPLPGEDAARLTPYGPSGRQ